MIIKQQEAGSRGPETSFTNCTFPKKLALTSRQLSFPSPVSGS